LNLIGIVLGSILKFNLNTGLLGRKGSVEHYEESNKYLS
jgi:hypothetical protein